MQRFLRAPLMGAVCLAMATMATFAQAHAQASSSMGACTPMSRTVFGLETPRAGLVDVLRRAIEPHGWRLVSNAPQGWPGPMVELQPTLQGMDGASALRLLIDQAARAGWDVQMIADRSDCTASVQFDPQRMNVLVEQVQMQAQVAQQALHPGAGLASGMAPSGQTLARGLQLLEGQRVLSQLQSWLSPQGWTVQWRLDSDWVIPASVDMGTSDALEAVDRLAQWLLKEGRAVQFTAFEGNRVLVVESLAPLGEMR